MATISVTTTVQPGGKVEVVSADLPVGQEVRVTVTVEAPPPSPPLTCENLMEWLASLPPGPRSAATWEEIERDFQEGRNSWDR